MVDDVSTGSAGECSFSETGTVLWSGAADWMRPSVPKSVMGADKAAEAGIISSTLESPLKIRDKRFLYPDFDNRPEDTDLASQESLGPWPSSVAASLAVR